MSEHIQDALMLGLLVGFLLGMAVAHWSWRRKIREKAKSGFRLAMGDQLYRVTFDHDWNIP